MGEKRDAAVANSSVEVYTSPVESACPKRSNGTVKVDSGEKGDRLKRAWGTSEEAGLHGETKGRGQGGDELVGKRVFSSSTAPPSADFDAPSSACSLSDEQDGLSSSNSPSCLGSGPVGVGKRRAYGSGSTASDLGGSGGMSSSRNTR